MKIFVVFFILAQSLTSSARGDSLDIYRQDTESVNWTRYLLQEVLRRTSLSDISSLGIIFNNSNDSSIFFLGERPCVITYDGVVNADGNRVHRTPPPQRVPECPPNCPDIRPPQAYVYAVRCAGEERWHEAQFSPSELERLRSELSIRGPNR